VAVEQRLTYEKGINLCSSSIETFNLEDEEKPCLKRETKENMAQINCALYKYCGFKIKNPTSCDKLYEQPNQE
jgi:hypothetical protein